MRRYDQIMQAIELGLSDEELARKFDPHHAPDQAMATMRVYQMVHDGPLPLYGGLSGKHGRLSNYFDTIAMRLQKIYGRGQW